MALAGAASGQATRLDLNIPAYRLSVIRDSSVVRVFRVAVGMRSYPTPTGVREIDDVTWNPWWHPPRSAWALSDSTQPPGPDNPMGAVKLFIGGTYYVHGTPLDQSIGHAASHGCVRMHQRDAIELARIVLRAQSDSGRALVQAAPPETTSVTMEQPLAAPIPITIRYDLTEIRGDSLMLYPDIYRHRRGPPLDAAIAALANLGVDTTSINRTKLGALVRRSARQRVAVRLSSIGVRPPR